MATYWQDRQAAAQNAITNKTKKEIDKQIQKYYKSLTRQVIADYESLYNQVLVKKAAGEAISPATIYAMDKYWSMNAQLRKRLDKTNSSLVSMLSKLFEISYWNSYDAIKIKGLKAFKTINNDGVRQVLNSVWAADGKTWSERIWGNLEQLKESLNDGLIHCVVAGKKTSQLKKILQERFNVSHSRADMLVRTELAHIQTVATKQRYMDYGIQEVQIWASEDERRCPICGKLHEKIYPIGATIPIPRHPNCRCCVVPVIK